PIIITSTYARARTTLITSTRYPPISEKAPLNHPHPSFPTRRSSDLLKTNSTAHSAKSPPKARPKYAQGPLSAPKAGLGRILAVRSEEHTSELQSRFEIVCRLLLD